MKDLLYALVLVVLLVALGFLLAKTLKNKDNKVQVDSAMIQSKLAECSDLTTCNLQYVDLVKFSSGDNSLNDQEKFLDDLPGQYKGRIDLSLAKVEAHNKKIVVYLPETEIQSIDVDTDSLRFYDEHFALFSWNEREDISEAIRMAREDILTHADLNQLKAQARKQAETVIYKLVSPVNDEKEIEIVSPENEIDEKNVSKQLEARIVPDMASVLYDEEEKVTVGKDS